MRRGRWIWFFAALLILAAVAVATPWILNVNQQLKPEQVTAARALWRERGPRDYDLQYQERIDMEPRFQEIHVEVRDGRVVAAQRNGQSTTEPVCTVDTMLDTIEESLQNDRAAGQRHYTVAVFDAGDGHPLRYVRRARGSHERLEWRVKVRAAALKPGPTN